MCFKSHVKKEALIYSGLKKYLMCLKVTFSAHFNIRLTINNKNNVSFFFKKLSLTFHYVTVIVLVYKE